MGVLKKGSIFICPACKSEYCEALSDIPVAGKILASDFKGLQKQPLLCNSPIRCFKCKHKISIQEFSTRSNWLVNE